MIKLGNYAKILKDKNKLLLCNFSTGDFVKVNKNYFEVLNKLIITNQIDTIQNKDTNIERNLMQLYEDLCSIQFYIDDTKSDVNRKKVLMLYIFH